MAICLPKRLHAKPLVPWDLRELLHQRLRSRSSETPGWADDVEATVYAVYGSCGLVREYCNKMTDIAVAIEFSPHRAEFLGTDPSLVALLDHDTLRRDMPIDNRLAKGRQIKQSQKEFLDKTIREQEARQKATERETDVRAIRCRNPQCRSTNIDSYEKQMRSADEPATMFYRCLDCDTQWRT